MVVLLLLPPLVLPLVPKKEMSVDCPLTLLPLLPPFLAFFLEVVEEGFGGGTSGRLVGVVVVVLVLVAVVVVVVVVVRLVVVVVVVIEACRVMMSSRHGLIN